MPVLRDVVLVRKFERELAIRDAQAPCGRATGTPSVVGSENSCGHWRCVVRRFSGTRIAWKDSDSAELVRCSRS